MYNQGKELFKLPIHAGLLTILDDLLKKDDHNEMVFFLNALLNSFNSIKKDLEKTENLCETHEIVDFTEHGHPI